MIHHILDLRGAPVLTALFLLLFWLESKFELRKRAQSKWPRLFVNFSVAIPSFVLLRFMFLPIMLWLANANEHVRFGFLYLFDFSSWQKAIIGFLLLDYGNYLWHWLNHKIPFLWRFHLVHHSDPDLDISTAFRFHYGELIGSVFSRGAFVFFSGVSPLMVLIYEIIFESATQFHHSNMKIPIKWERLLNLLIVTPRMHGIHHSIIKEETDSNYSVIFSFWDRLHHTVKLNVPQKNIIIGAASCRNLEELTASHLLKLPFSKTVLEIPSMPPEEQRPVQGTNKNRLAK
ncbi:MAG: sterol desaturase family protein [Bacteroidetes bacterium]|nr:sterol desaturase family protein [Bacteroidota bacterium]